LITRWGLRAGIEDAHNPVAPPVTALEFTSRFCPAAG
jgi:hypothetical protein